MKKSETEVEEVTTQDRLNSLCDVLDVLTRGIALEPSERARVDAMIADVRVTPPAPVLPETEEA